MTSAYRQTKPRMAGYRLLYYAAPAPQKKRPDIHYNDDVTANCTFMPWSTDWRPGR